MARTVAKENKKKLSRIKALLAKHTTVLTLSEDEWLILKKYCGSILQQFDLSKMVTLAEIREELTLQTQLTNHTRFSTAFINANNAGQPLLRAFKAYVDSQLLLANPAPTVRLVPTAEDARVLNTQADLNFLIRRRGDMPRSTHKELLARVFATRLPCKVDGRLVVAVHGEPADKEDQWLLIDITLNGPSYDCIWIQKSGQHLQIVSNSCLHKDLTFGN